MQYLHLVFKIKKNKYLVLNLFLLYVIVTVPSRCGSSALPVLPSLILMTYKEVIVLSPFLIEEKKA